MASRREPVQDDARSVIPEELPDLLVASRTRRLEGGERPDRDPTLASVRRGYFRPSAEPLNTAQEHLLRIHATAQARHLPVAFSRASAAVLWGCPLMRADLSRVHVAQPGRSRRTTAGVSVHRGAVPDGHFVELPSGLVVTSREWTAIEIAASLQLPNVLVPLDHLVRTLAESRRLTSPEVVELLLDLVPGGMKARARAQRHLALADGRSGSAGESLSRGQMELLGVPKPDLQVSFRREDGTGLDIVDFDWPELGVFGEFDGETKYRDERMRSGRSAEEVVWDEKQREDRLRRKRPGCARWVWSDALDRSRLARILAAAGVARSR